MPTKPGVLAGGWGVAVLLIACGGAPGTGAAEPENRPESADTIGNAGKGESCLVDFWCSADNALVCSSGGRCVAKPCAGPGDCEGYGAERCSAEGTCLPVEAPRVLVTAEQCGYPALPGGGSCRMSCPRPYLFYRDGGSDDCMPKVPPHAPGSLCATSTFFCNAIYPGPAGVLCACPVANQTVPGHLI